MVLPLIVNVARGGLAFNTIAPKPILKIHPSIGIARVGDDPTVFFIGPELPLTGSTGQDASVGSPVPPFRNGGAVKRQAARFRVFHYPVGLAAEELTTDHPDVAQIEWTVHLANRKAAFFEFNGQIGATPAGAPYTGPRTSPRNNTIVGPARETQLVIDPGPRSIKGAIAGPVRFDSTKGNWPKDSSGTAVINYLGELQTDDKGRLLVLGGRGKSASSNALPPNAVQMAELGQRGFRGTSIGAARPPAPLLEYANNDTWFDDISDGPVTAKVTLKSGKKIAVQFPAWVLVGPPDFAPQIRNVISLYDTIFDVAVRELPLPAAPFYSPIDLADLAILKASIGASPPGQFGANFQAEFFTDIDPILQAGFDARFVHEPIHSGHTTLVIPTLQSALPADKPTRELVFNFLRPPAGNTIYSGQGAMPKLFGDKYFDVGDVRRVAAVTQTQHHILERWKDGNFFVAPGPITVLTPDGLDRASLENCVGGAFFPGIECSWLVREKGLYSEPFRIKHGATIGPLTVGPGFFSQQMALPWQSDFLDCAKGDSEVGVFFGWWPAQRPDDVYQTAANAAAETGMVPWVRGVLAPQGAPRDSSHANMVRLWNQLGFVVAATVGGKKVFFEQERILP